MSLECAAGHLRGGLGSAAAATGKLLTRMVQISGQVNENKILIAVIKVLM